MENIPKTTNKIFNKIHVAFICILLQCNILSAQNQFGISPSNYGGLYSLQINPANICYQPVSLDINIMSVDGYLNNNHFYATPTFLLSNSSFNPVIGNAKFNEEKMTSSSFVIRNGIQNTGYAIGGINIMGPSLLLAISTKKSFAITTGFRTHMSGTNISGSTALALFEGATYSKLQNTQVNMEDTKLAFASWFEIGGSYAQVIKDNSRYVHRLGGSVKLLLGMAGGYIYDNGFHAYNETGRDLQVKDASFSYAFAGPEYPVKNNDMTKVRGMGVSADLGYSIQKKEKNRHRRNTCPNLFGYTDVSCEYKWKAGVSLLDFGAIKFYNNAFATDIIGGNSDWKNWDGVFKYNQHQIDSIFRLNIASKETKTSDAFWLVMPGAISAQFDYKFTEGFYVNSTIIQRITPSNTPSLSRMNSIAVTPRFEKEFIEISMPLILNEYKDMNVGMAVRYKYFIIGSDRVGETFGLKTMYGANLYMGVRYSISERCKKVKKFF